jgi:hypothetical protein
VGGVTGDQLSHLARPGFISSMDLGLITGAAVAAAAGLLALAALPSRLSRPPAGAHPANGADNP